MMSGRGLGRVLRCTDCLFKTALRVSRSQKRPFSGSAPTLAKNRVPMFTETSSSELDQILSHFRLKSFLPAYLSPASRALIYGTKHKQLLEDEPVMVLVGGEQFQLQHIDRTKDVLHNIKHLFRAVDLMESKKDWNNLPMLLEGIYNSEGTKLTTPAWEKLVRKAGRAGQIQKIILAAQRPSNTGLRLREATLVVNVMWWIQQSAWHIGTPPLQPTRTKAALEQAELFAELLEDDMHCGGPVRGKTDPRARPEVIGVLLQLASAEALRLKNADSEDKVKKYAERLAVTMSQGVDWSEAWDEGLDERHARDRFLRNASPVLFGMRKAGTILDPKSAIVTDLKRLEMGLAADLAPEYDFLESIEPDKLLLGQECYQLFGLERGVELAENLQRRKADPTQ